MIPGEPLVSLSQSDCFLSLLALLFLARPLGQILSMPVLANLPERCGEFECLALCAFLLASVFGPAM